MRVGYVFHVLNLQVFHKYIKEGTFDIILLFEKCHPRIQCITSKVLQEIIRFYICTPASRVYCLSRTSIELKLCLYFTIQLLNFTKHGLLIEI